MSDGNGFYCNPIRNKDADGRLIEAGVAWIENSEFYARNRWRGYTFLVFALIFFGGSAVGFPALMVLPLGLAFLGLAAYYTLRTGQDRALIFSTSNETEAPKGLVSLNGSGLLRDFKPAAITSIEMHSQMPNSYISFTTGNIRLMTEEGDTIIVTTGLHEDHARKVARQLIKAHEEIRLAMAEQL